jgi:riboflavin biosynthesis pyrimidine reductase
VTLTPLELLDERPGLPQFELPSELSRLYNGGLGLNEPCVYANFVHTIDGVVAIPELERSNALVADQSEADRFVMGLLRALADVVLVGTGTMLASPQGTWRPERVYPPAAEAYAELRRARGRGERPAVAIVTSGASFDPAHPIVASGALVLTTERAAPELRAVVPPASEVVAVNDGDWVDLVLAVEALRERGHSLVLSEAGPTTFGELLAQAAADELFLTVSPVFAGRVRAARRLSLVEGVELLPQTHIGGDLVSVRRHGDHLFLRYRIT